VEQIQENLQAGELAAQLTPETMGEIDRIFGKPADEDD
jgi:hypothetical protein